MIFDHCCHYFQTHNKWKSTHHTNNTPLSLLLLNVIPIDTMPQTEKKLHSVSNSIHDDLYTSTNSAFQFITRMVLEQIAAEVEEESRDDDTKINHSERDGDLQTLETLWERQQLLAEASRDMNTQGKLLRPFAILRLEPEWYLDDQCILFLTKKIQQLRPEDRPVKLILLSEIENSLHCAELMALFFELCRSTMEEVVFRGQKRNFLPSEYLYNHILISALQCPNLKSLALEQLYLSPVFLGSVAQTMVSHHANDDDNVSQEGMMMTSCQIHSLSIKDSLIYCTDDLACALEQYNGLSRLVIRDCEIRDEQFSFLATALENSDSKLTHLDVSHNGLTCASVAEVARILMRQTELQYLNLSQNPLFVKTNDEQEETIEEEDSDPKMLYKAIRRHPSLQDLRLNGCGLMTSTIKPLLLAIGQNCNIVHFQMASLLGDITMDSSWWGSNILRMNRLRSKLTTACQCNSEDPPSGSQSGRRISSEPKTRYKQQEALHSMPHTIPIDKASLSVLCRNRLLHQISIDLEGHQTPKHVEAVKHLARKSKSLLDAHFAWPPPQKWNRPLVIRLSS